MSVDGLAQGTATVCATTYDLAGNMATSCLTGFIDSLAEIALDTPIAGDDFIDASELAAGLDFSGTTIGIETGQVVNILLEGENGFYAIGETTVQPGETWSVAFTSLQVIVQVNDPDSGDYDLEPDVATLPDGGWVVVWADATGGSGQALIAARQYTAEGIPLGPQLTVNSGVAVNTRSPRVAALTNEGWVVA